MNQQEKVTNKLRDVVAKIMHAETLDLRVEYVIALRQLASEIDNELFRQFAEAMRTK